MTDKELQKILSDKINSFDSKIDLDENWSLLSKKIERKKKDKRILFVFASFGIIAGLGLLLALGLNVNQKNKNTGFDSDIAAKEVVLEQEKSIAGAEKISSKEIRTALESDNNTLGSATKIGNRKNIPVNFRNNNKKNSLRGSTFLNGSENDINSNTIHSSRNTGLGIKNSIQDEYDKIIDYKNNKRIDAIKHIVFLPSLISPNTIFEPGVPTIDLLKIRKSKSRNDILFSIGGGLLLSPMYFRSKTDESKSLKEQRDKNEKSLETYQLNLGIKYDMKRFYMSAGLLYHRWYNKLKYREINDKKYQLKNALVEERYYSIAESVEKVYADTSVIGKQITDGKYFTNFHAIDIYLSLGHKVLSNRYFSLNIDGGVLTNIYFKGTGKTINQDNFGISDVSNVYKSKIGLGIVSNISVEHRLTDNIVLSLNANGIFYLDNISRPSYHLETNLIRYGIGTNLKYRF